MKFSMPKFGGGESAQAFKAGDMSKKLQMLGAAFSDDDEAMMKLMGPASGPQQQRVAPDPMAAFNVGMPQSSAGAVAEDITQSFSGMPTMKRRKPLGFGGY